MASVYPQKKKIALWQELFLFVITIPIGTIGADPRFAHLWWLFAVLMLAGTLGKNSGQKWGPRLLKTAFLALGLLAAGATGYSVASIIETFRQKIYLGGPFQSLSFIFLIYFFSFSRFVWSDTAETMTGETAAPAPKRPPFLPVIAILLIAALLGLAAGFRYWHLGGHTAVVNSLAFSPDGKFLASGSRDTSIKLWEVKSGKLLRTLTGHKGEVSALTFSRDGALLASGGWAWPEYDYSVKLWNPTTGQLLRTFSDPTGGVFSLAFSNDDKLLAAGTQGHLIRIWEIATGKLINTFKADDSVGFVAFSPDDTILVSGTRERILVWDSKTGKCLHNVFGYCPVSMHSAHNMLAIGLVKSKDRLEQLAGTLVLFDATKGIELRALKGPAVYPNDFTFSRPLVSPLAWDWSELAVAEPWPSTTINLWNMASGKKTRAFSRFILLGSTFRFERLLLSPDGKYLAVGSDDRAPLVVWEVANGRRRAFNGGWLKL